MKVPKGWFLLYPPKYRTPTVFDLHERGLFTSMPYVSQKSGACLIINEDLWVSVYYRYVVEGHQVKNNISYSYLAEKGLIRLNEDMQLNEKELTALNRPEAEEEIRRVHEEWFSSYTPSLSNGRIDRAELEKKLKASLKEGIRLFREKVKRKNSSWIDPALNVMTWRFKHTLYNLVFDQFYSDYQARGGEDGEEGIISKIGTFCRIYEGRDTDNLIKPDGNRWQNDDEIWDCWIAYSGSESEAERVCQSMEAVFRPLYATL